MLQVSPASALTWRVNRNMSKLSPLTVRLCNSIPSFPGLQLNLGLAEFKQGHFSSAATALRSALKADPSSTQARTLLGMSYYGARKFDLASEYLEPVANADPNNAELHQMLAQSCLWAKKLTCAQEQFRLLLQQHPDSAPTHILMGEALRRAGQDSRSHLRIPGR